MFDKVVNIANAVTAIATAVGACIGVALGVRELSAK